MEGFHGKTTDKLSQVVSTINLQKVDESTLFEILCHDSDINIYPMVKVNVEVNFLSRKLSQHLVNMNLITNLDRFTCGRYMPLCSSNDECETFFF